MSVEVLDATWKWITDSLFVSNHRRIYSLFREHEPTSNGYLKTTLFFRLIGNDSLRLWILSTRYPSTHIFNIAKEQSFQNPWMHIHQVLANFVWDKIMPDIERCTFIHPYNSWRAGVKTSWGTNSSLSNETISTFVGEWLYFKESKIFWTLISSILHIGLQVNR